MSVHDDRTQLAALGIRTIGERDVRASWSLDAVRILRRWSNGSRQRFVVGVHLARRHERRARMMVVEVGPGEPVRTMTFRLSELAPIAAAAQEAIAAAAAIGASD